MRDPDGNTILLGQRGRPGTAPPREGQDESSRFSLLREAAAAASAGAKPAIGCQLSDAAGRPCPDPAEVRLADSAGTAVWACIAHAEEILVMVPGAFVAREEDTGIASYHSPGGTGSRTGRKPVRLFGTLAEALAKPPPELAPAP